MGAESSVRIIFTGNASGAVRSVRSLESSFSSLGRTAKIAAGAVAIGFGVALGSATKAAIDFDKAMRNVQSLTHSSEKSFQSLSRQVLALAGPTGQAPKTLAEGLYDIVSSGFQASDAITILGASAKAATAGMTDTATATKAVVAILNAYHLSAGKAREVSDTLFQEVNLGVNTFADLAQNIGDTAPAAAALGIPFSEVSAALATITRQGNDMSLASTQVARVLISLIKPSKGMTAELKHMGFESGQAAIKSLGFSGVVRRLSQDAKGNQQTLIDWTGDIRGFRGIVGLTGKNLETYTALVRQMGGATAGVGATQRAFAEQAKSISFQWQRAKASLTAAAIPIGQLLFPALIKGAQGVTYLATAIQQHMPQIKRLTNEATRAIADGWQRYAIPAMRIAQQVVRSVASFIRAHWAEIRSTSIAVGRAVQQGFAVVKQAVQAVIPVVRAVAPIFKAAFSVALAIIRAFAVVAATSLKLTAAEINIVKAVVRPLAPIFNAAFAAAAAAVKAAGAVITGILGAINAAIHGTISALHALGSAIGAVKSLPGKIGGIAGKVGGLIPGHAAGGFVAGSAGSPQVILAHAGEVILNTSQQAAFGGAAFFKQMFGFTGGEGPGFASGGIVGKRPDPPKRRRSGSSPHHKPRSRVKTRNVLARKALAAVDVVNQTEDDTDRSYGQLVRQFDISQETYIRTGPDGVDYISQPDIDQRVSEIDQLIRAREQMLALLDEEKKKLKAAIAALRKAIATMIAAIKRENKAASADSKAISGLAKQISREQRKKKPNQRLINSLQAQSSQHEKSRQGHLNRSRDLAGTVGDFRSAIKDQSLNLNHTLPLDRGDVALDIGYLQAERKDVSGTTLPPAPGGSAAGGGTAADNSDLLRLIGQLRLALGIQTVQQGIIGSFAKGTLHVPNTGLAMVHAGESITPAGQSRGGDGGSIGDVHVKVIVEDGAVNADRIRVEAVKATDAIMLKTGQSASERRRSNRF